MMRIYLHDWFVNAGVVGFFQVLSRYEDRSNWKAEHNYVEFEPQLLEGFAKNFFEALIEKYSKSKQDQSRIANNLKYAQNKDYFSDNKKSIQELVKSTREKAKKAGLDLQAKKIDEIFQQLKKVKKHQEFEQLLELSNQYLELLKDQELHDLLTINYIRSVLGNLYGQPSFLNPSFKGKKEDFIQKFHDDFVEPVIEECHFITWLRSIPREKWENALKTKKKEKNLPPTFSKLVKEVHKQVKEYGVLIPCSIQSDFPGTVQYEEMMFSPLGLSLKNINISWNANKTTLPISYMSRLLLFSSSVCLTQYSKKRFDFQQRASEYINYFAFINADDTIDSLEKKNKQFEQRKDKENPMPELVYDLLTETEQKSEWALQNLLFIEFSADGKNSKLDYFHIPKKIAAFFREHGASFKVWDKRFRNDVIQAILNRKDPIHQIGNYLRNRVVGDQKADDCQKLLVSRHKLYHYLRGEVDVKEKQPEKKLWVFYKQGEEIAKFYYENSRKHQLSTITYRLLNACNAGNKQMFFDSVMRLYMTANKEISPLFLNVFHEQQVEFTEAGYSFIAGLQYKPDEQQKKED